MGDAKRAAALRIEIGVQYAAAPPKLELEAGAFANLERRLAEMAHELVGRKSVEFAAQLRRGRRRSGLRHLLARRAHAGGKQEDGDEGE